MASDNAAAAALAARNQSAKEKLWRGWRYCELGGEVANANLNTANKWWSNLEDATDAVKTAAAAPATCVVPAVTNSAGAEVRPAITYHTNTATIAT